MLYDNIREILNRQVLVTVDQIKNKIILKENSKQSKTKPIELYGINKDAVVFKLDIDKSGFKLKSNYLSKKKGIHAGCDYVIITEYSGETIVLFCELKSDDEGGAKSQLINSIPFIEYIKSLISVHYETDLPIFNNYFVIFSTKKSRIDKQKTSSRKLHVEEFRNNLIRYGGNPNRINISKIII